MTGVSGRNGAGDADQADPADEDGVNLQSLARGGVFTLLGSAVAAVLGFTLTVLLTRNVNAATVGVVFAISSIFLIAFTVVRLGASTGAVYFVARLSALGESDRIRSVLRSALAPVVWVSVVSALVLVILAGPLGRLIVPDHPEEAVRALRVMALFLPFAAVMDVCLFGTRGLHRLRPLVVIDKVGRPLLQVSLVAICIAVGANSASALAFAWAGPYLPAAIAAAVWLWYLLAHVERKRGIEAPVAGTMHEEFWTYSWPRWLQSIAQIGLQRLDIILVAALAGPVEAAVYAAVTVPRVRPASGRLPSGRWLSQGSAGWWRSVTRTGCAPSTGSPRPG